MSFIDLNWVDIVFMILGLYFIIRGCFRGLTGEIITLAGFIVSLYASFHYSGRISEYVVAWTGVNQTLAQVIAIFVIWIALTFVTVTVKKILSTILSAVSLGGVDKLLGFVSGCCKLVLSIYVVLIIGVLAQPLIAPTWMSKSVCLKYAGRYWPVVRQTIIDTQLLPQAQDLPDSTLDEILAPYRTDRESPFPEREQGTI